MNLGDIMNKSELIKALSSKIGYSVEDTTRINDVLEENFIIGKKNKEKIISRLMEVIKIDEVEANRIYNSFAELLKDGLVDKLKHPFGK